MHRHACKLKGYSEELLHLASERGMPTWLGMGTSYRGEAMIMLGRVQEGITLLHEALTLSQSLDVRVYTVTTLRSLAMALAEAGHPEEGLTILDEALALVEETGERHWEAEVHRARAALLVMQGKHPDAEASYHKAIEVARRQSARSWELRATTGLARLWQEQGRREEARQMLTDIYGWFTEGFDTPDLVEARALLDELAPS